MADIFNWVEYYNTSGTTPFKSQYTNRNMALFADIANRCSTGDANLVPTDVYYSKANGQYRVIGAAVSPGIVPNAIIRDGGYAQGMYTSMVGRVVDRIQITDISFRMYPVLKPLKTYLTTANTRERNIVVECNLNYGASLTDNGCKMTEHNYTDYINAIPDDVYVIDHYEFYTDIPGQTQTLAKSWKGGQSETQYIDSFSFCTVSQKLAGQTTTTQSTYAFAMFGNTISENAYDTNTYMNGLYTGLHRVNLVNGKTGSPVNGSVFCPGVNYNSYSNRYNLSSYAIYGTKKEWANYFNQCGFKWSFDLDKIKDGNDDDLNIPPSPGQPYNPEDDDDGDGDNTSDDIDYPKVTITPSAFARYWIKPTQISDFKRFLFEDTFLSNIKRLWENPGEYVIDATYYPIDPGALGISGELGYIIVGNINSQVSGYQLPDTANVYHFGGSFKVEPYYNSYLDYEPYTNISIYIPYIGIRPLNASRITGHKLLLAYTFDFGTHQITAHLGLDGDMTVSGGSLGNALDSFTGSFGVSQPFSGTQNNQMVLNVLQQSAGVISGLGAIAGGVATSNPGAVIKGAGSVIGGIASGSLTPETYGTLTPTAGLYSPQIPYLIIDRPIAAEPKDYRTLEGYSAAYSGYVSGFSGFLKCSAAEISQSGTMSEQEQKEIISLLTGGIYI